MNFAVQKSLYCLVLIESYDQDMAQVHMTEAEVTSDIAAVLKKVRQGTEVFIEEGNRTIAVISPVKGPGRPIDECIALAKAYEEKLDYAPVLDADFGGDLQEIIDRCEPLRNVWDE